ncbi:MAG: phosphoethanolamine transferase [Burkholderiales bacterium]|nr:phosphoethanolamine transferase [Burkholderiales bacterium]
MHPLLRRGNLFVLITYLILSATPFSPLLHGRTVAHPALTVGLESVAWLTAWTAFKRPAWFHWLLLPAFLAMPAELYLQTFYNQGISTHHLGLIAETSPRETLEFLGKQAWTLALVLVGIVAWWGTSWWAAWRTHDLDLSGKRRWISAGALAAFALVGDYGQYFGIKPDPDVADASQHASAKPIALKLGSTSYSLPQLPAWAGSFYDTDRFKQAWPFGLAIHGYDFWHEHRLMVALASQRQAFKFGAHQASHGDEAQIIVMVIGESSRYDRWEINGYPRATNPLLMQEGNLVSLSDMVTAVSATRLSVPVIISRKPALQSLKPSFSEKSFLSAYKEAGFKTFWLSNQMTFGKFDTPISAFAEEADVVRYLDLGEIGNISSFDDVLLGPFKGAIADPAKKKLIVLHTLGSHWNYSQRYPRDFDRWKPSLFGVDDPVYTDIRLKPQLNNSYDSSVLYTDWFLSQIIGLLKSTRQVTAMMYSSDHGESLYDGSCEWIFHGGSTQYDFHIPALVWYSDQYRDAYPDKVAELAHNKDARLSTENIFHSLVDMVDIRYPSENLEWSFLSPQWKPHRRNVDSKGWSDYDNSIFQGDCREVVDKGKPWPRGK